MKRKRPSLTVEDFDPGDRVMVIVWGPDANLIGCVLDRDDDPAHFRDLVKVDIEPNALGAQGGWVWIEPEKLVKLPASEG